MLRRELASLLRHQVEDPALDGVGVTDVEVSPDLSLAKIYLSVAAPEAEEQALKGAARANGFFRKRLATMLHLRAVPKLVFKIDPTFDAVARIEELVADAKDDG